MLNSFVIVLIVFLALFAGPSHSELNTSVPLHKKGSTTYYVSGEIKGLGPLDFLIDTGSSYTTINEKALNVLQNNGAARFLKKLTGVMADGSRKTVALYRVLSINIGGNCRLNDVEVAVFPGTTRNILGISALNKLAPFTISLTPPSLMLSHCG